MAAQIIVLRELSIVFYGNEISIGFILGSWLFWGAAGSWLLGRFSDRFQSKLILFSSCQLVLTFLLILSLLAIRSIKLYFGLAPGEIIGFIPMVFSSFFVLAPICVLLGFMFSLGCRVYQDRFYRGAQNIGLAYGWESAGAMFGGALSSFVFIRFLNPITISVFLGLLNILAAVWLLFKLKKIKALFFMVILIAGIILWIFRVWDSLDEYSRKRQWQGYQILGAKNSIYGNIMVTKRGSLYSIFDNGLHLYSIPDEQAAEEAVHFALLEQANPRDVLLVGGGAGGLIREILKYPIKSIDYLELDPLIIKMAEKHLPPGESGPLKDAKVSIHNLDGRFFIKAATKKYDCIIIHLGDPYTTQINRYYTIEFFKEIKKALNENGIFSFALSSSENYISPELGDYLRSVYLGLRTVFKDVLVIPGDTAYFLACDSSEVITSDYNVLMLRAKTLNLNLKYVREYYLFSKLSPQLFGYTESILLQKTRVKPNYDFHPSTYYYNMIFWAARLGEPGFQKVLKAIDFRGTFNAISGICIFIILIGIIWRRKNKYIHQQASLIALLVTSFSSMAILVVILFSLQIIYGYVFSRIGFLLTVFMAGLALGSFWMAKLIGRFKKHLNIMILINFLFCILSSSLPVLFFWLSTSNKEAVAFIGANIIFPLLSAVIGLFVGVQFATANKISLNDGRQAGEVSGLTYGIDLLGSCLGALLSGIFLIPVLGITWSCLAIAIINLSIFVLLSLLSHKALIS
ncbi:MAG: fused MFS/spermidine synthase [Candidatus Omnitrophica bacterium]|nr:fused MFS/spermidine synthase [Candidatus Omnitrophota bacterium]